MSKCESSVQIGVLCSLHPQLMRAQVLNHQLQWGLVGGLYFDPSGINQDYCSTLSKGECNARISGLCTLHPVGWCELNS